MRRSIEGGLWAAIPAVLLAVPFACVDADQAARPAIDPSKIWSDSKSVALARAIVGGNLREIDRLVSEGADVNAAHTRRTGRVDMTPLVWAMLHGQKAAFECLLEHGADPKRPYEHYDSLLHAIAHWGDDSTWLSLVLKHKADPNFGPDRPLVFAAIQGGRAESVEMLVKAGAKVNVKLDDDATPLLAAAASGVAQSWEMVDCLLRAGADYRVRDQFGRDVPQLLIEQMVLPQWQRPNAVRDKVIDWLAERGVGFREAEEKLSRRESERPALDWWYDVRDAHWVRWAAIVPATPREYILRGSARRGKGEFDGAIADFTKAIEIAPEAAAGYKLRGDAWYAKGLNAKTPTGEYRRAVADYSEALRLNPNAADAFAARAAARYWQRNLEGSVHDYSAAIDADSNNAELYWRRGDARQWYAFTAATAVERPEVWAHAIADCDEAIRRDPRDPRAFNARGLVWLRQLQYDKAIADQTAAIKLDADYAGSYSDRGEAWSRMASIATDPRKPLSDEVRQWYANAIDDFTSAIKLDPDNFTAFGRRGAARLAIRDFDRAIADYTEAIRLDDYVGDYISRAEVFKTKGDIDAAIADLSKAVSLPSPDAWTTKRAFTARGDLWLVKKDHDRAVADYTRAEDYTKRRDVWTSLGEFEKVIDDLKASIRREPKNPWNYESLGRLLATCPKVELRDPAGAIANAEKACEVTAWRDGMFINVLAEVCAKTGDFEAAVKWERKAIEAAKFDFFKTRYRKALESYQAGKIPQTEDKK